MKERPILFNGEMVRAILDGSKTQTRRIVKPQPGAQMEQVLINNRGEWPCPLGKAGDRLWVRETWSASHSFDHLPPRLIQAEARFHYLATEDKGGLLWRPSIHMPRWASRITLEITNVRVEQLQSISEEDAFKEGCFAGDWEYDNAEGTESARETFECLWDSIYQNWDENPWVWAIEFKKVEK